MPRAPMTVRDITHWALETDAERAWAERMGSDHRRAWDTAPTGAILVLLGLHLATAAGRRRLTMSVVDLLGGDGEEVARVLDSWSRPVHQQIPFSWASLHDLPGLRRADGEELARQLRARISYASLFAGAAN